MKTHLSKYLAKPLSWWLKTPLYAKRHIIARLGEMVASKGAEGDVDHIVFNEFFKDQKQGVFVEIGAARPDFLSIGALFRARGWRVLSIEPNPIFCEMHRAKGHEIYQYACGTHDENNVEFCVVHAHGKGEVSNESYSSLSVKPEYLALEPDQNLNIEKIRVNLRRVDTILRDHASDITKIDCVSIDVEGWEIEVLEGLDLERFAPRVLIIENLLDNDAYRKYMLNQGYRLSQTLFPNEVYERAN